MGACQSNDYGSDKTIHNPPRLINREKAGSAYLITRLNRSQSEKTLFLTSLLIDVSGESNSKELIGKELTVRSQGPAPGFLLSTPPKQGFSREELQSSLFLGQLPLPQKFIFHLEQWSSQLELETDGFLANHPQDFDPEELFTFLKSLY